MSDKLEAAFVREERYIVIKRKRLSPEHEDDIRELLASRDTPTIECVVVESDWPEYDTVWKMIEDRVNGREGGHRDAMVRAFEASGWSHFLAEKQADIALSVLRTPTPEQAGEVESDGWERGMKEAANICGSLSETTYDDADAFEAAVGCEAAIMSNLNMHQRNRASTPPAQPTAPFARPTDPDDKSWAEWTVQPTADAVERARRNREIATNMVIQKTGWGTQRAERLADAILAALPSPVAGDYVMVPPELRKMSERATWGPWCWEQCGDKQDDPVVGIAFPADDKDGERPYPGRLTDDTADRYCNIAFEWPNCDGHSGSANAEFVVASVNWVRALIAASPTGGE